jgi:hypothetical protein
MISALAVLSINYAKAKLQDMYNNNNHDKYSEIGISLANTRATIDSLGISQNAKVIVLSDETPNGGLNFLNRKGWNLRDPQKKVLIKSINTAL